MQACLRGASHLTAWRVRVNGPERFPAVSHPPAPATLASNPRPFFPPPSSLSLRPRSLISLPKAARDARVRASAGSGAPPLGESTGVASLCETLTRGFPYWVATAAALALIHPPLLLWFRGDLIVWALSLTMLAMGTTLTLGDFSTVLSKPSQTVVGAMLQYTVMPLLGLTVSKVMGLGPDITAGIVLVRPGRIYPLSVPPRRPLCRGDAVCSPTALSRCDFAPPSGPVMVGVLLPRRHGVQRGHIPGRRRRRTERGAHVCLHARGGGACLCVFQRRRVSP